MLTDGTAVESNAAVRRIAALTGFSARDELLYAASTLLATLFTLRFAIRIVGQQLRIRFREAVRNDLSCRLLAGFLDRPYTYHLASSSPRLVTMVLDDAANVSTLAGNSLAGIAAAATVLMVLAAMLVIDPLVTTISVFVIGLIAAATYVLQHRRIGALGRRGRKARQQLTFHASQALGSIRESRIMGTRDDQLAAFFAESRVLSAIRAKLDLMQSMPGLAVEWLVFLGVAGAIALLAADADAMTAVMPTLAAFLFAAIRIAPQLMSTVRRTAGAQFLRPSVESTYALLVADPAPPPDEAGADIQLRREIAIRRLSVSYEGAVRALRDVTLTIPRGAHVGIVGPSGAGKTTLINALLGFLQPAAGEIAVDDRSIFEGLRSWQRRVGLVLQDPFLLDGTIAENVIFGRRFADEESRLAQALAAVHLDTLIDALPRGARTPIGERGIRLSGGQRQRVAIARALYGDPEVVILDEATSQLDPEVAAVIDDAIAALRGRKTLIVVAHRLVSMVRCDFVVYLEAGRVADVGTMHELLARNPAFARFAGTDLHQPVVQAEARKA